jgi:hypothetical protein
MQFTLITNRRLTWCALAFLAGAAIAVYVRRSMNLYTEAYPATGVWAISSALFVCGGLLTVSLRWREIGACLATIGLFLLVGFSVAGSLTPGIPLGQLPVDSGGQTIRIQFRQGTTDPQVRAFMCEFVYLDCTATNGTSFRSGVLRVLQPDSGHLVVVTISQHSQILAQTLRQAPIVQEVSVGPV